MKKHKILRRILFAIEVVVLVALISGLYVYGQLTDRLSIINEVPAVTLNDEGKVDKGVIVTNEEAPKMTGYSTFALFGIDHRDKNEALAGENSDTMIICSLNHDTKELKMVSVYRDTLLNIGDDIYAKANAAYAYGGPQQAVNMLNTNLDLNITDYITIDFNALVEAVDALDGLDIPLSYAEIVHMNNYCIETAEETGKEYTPVELPSVVPENQEEEVGVYHLNGVQATSYCRIRYTSKMDMGRTERQRYVIQALISKATKSGIKGILNVMDKVFPMVKTSLGMTEILALIPEVMGYNMTQTGGFPIMYRFSNVRGSIIVPTTLSTNVTILHEFLYGDPAYMPSSNVETYSEKILAIVGGAENTQAEAPVVTYEQGDAEDIFIWQDDGSGGNTWTDYSYTTPPEEITITPEGTTPAPAEDVVTSDPAAPDGGTAPDGTAPAADGGTDPAAVPAADPAAPSADTGGGAAEPAPAPAEVVVPPAETPVEPAAPAEPAAPEPSYDTGADTGGGESYVDPGSYGGDTGYDDGGGYVDYSYDTGGYDAGYDAGGYDAGYDAGGYDELSAGG